ncbi:MULTISPECIES: AAA family ATPase [unclassified Nocardioides]|uniref:AAA family ATPase n=1 Tax=unclassified Nocardioides TaxID=2615069 RepID=UPI0006F42B88|nr:MULTISPECIES: AAA family ATPase [unclassified Nocardioides]KRA32710.1 AAA family ATPase [Nocardioides sp. Root614]KRA89362.1 AAA family ATPase [Nocardioides sp. Root682]
MDFDQPPVVRITAERGGVDPREWPMTVPAVAQVVREGLELPKGVTFLVGENGSGKSTLVEAIAVAYGLSPEGGSGQSRHSTRPTESPLHSALRLQRGLGTSRWGFFLRAETMHGWYTYLEDNPRSPNAREQDSRFHELSHGESFLEVLRTRFDSPGFYCLDEPEAALSFSSTLSLIAVLHDLVQDGGQVLCATHSPVLAAMPGATILEVGDWGLRPARWEDLELVQHWRSYLDDPRRYLRHVID